MRRFLIEGCSGSNLTAESGMEFDDRGGVPTKWDADEVPAAREARRVIPRALSDPELIEGESKG